MLFILWSSQVTINSGPCTYNPLDPTKNATYTFLRNFLEEMAAIFTDPYMHLGGDEASFIGHGQGCFVGDKARPPLSCVSTARNGAFRCGALLRRRQREFMSTIQWPESPQICGSLRSLNIESP